MSRNAHVRNFMVNASIKINFQIKNYYILYSKGIIDSYFCGILNLCRIAYERWYTLYIYKEG